MHAKYEQKIQRHTEDSDTNKYLDTSRRPRNGHKTQRHRKDLKTHIILEYLQNKTQKTHGQAKDPWRPTCLCRRRGASRPTKDPNKTHKRPHKDPKDSQKKTQDLKKPQGPIETYIDPTNTMTHKTHKDTQRAKRPIRPTDTNKQQRPIKLTKM